VTQNQNKTSGSKRSGGRATSSAKSGAKPTGSRAGSASTRSNSGATRAAKTRSSQSGSNGRSRTQRTAKASGAKRTTRSTAKSTNGSASRAAPSASANGRGSSGITSTVKNVASKAKGPAVAVGAAAAGVAGGLVIRSRTRRKTILGVPVPKHLPAVDPQAILKSVGSASKQLAKTSKSVSKDIERAGDQAEKIGKILG
jgi:hypothetical protein